MEVSSLTSFCHLMIKPLAKVCSKANITCYVRICLQFVIPIDKHYTLTVLFHILVTNVTPQCKCLKYLKALCNNGTRWNNKTAVNQQIIYNNYDRWSRDIPRFKADLILRRPQWKRESAFSFAPEYRPYLRAYAVSHIRKHVRRFVFLLPVPPLRWRNAYYQVEKVQTIVLYK